MTDPPSALGGVKVRYQIHSIAVQTACFEKAFDFYANILGLRVIRDPFRFGARTLTWLDGDGILIELFSAKEGEDIESYSGKMSGVNHIAFVVDDLDAVMEVMNAHKIRIVKGPMVPRSGDPRQPRILFVEGPDGASIQFRESEKR